MREFTLSKRGVDGTDQKITIPLTHTFAKVREDHHVEDEWIFMFPGMDIKRPMEAFLQV
jgi:hypothetical protein